MPVDLAKPNQIILIGPCNVGKSTIGKMLAERLGAPFVSLDTVERKYTLPAGFDPKRAEELDESGVPLAGYGYRRMFFDAAVIGFLADHREGVLELGGGHPIIPDREKQERVIAALRTYPRVVLLLPTADLKESIDLLRNRDGLAPDEPYINDLYAQDDTFLTLARHVVTTWGRTPEETYADVLAALGMAAPRGRSRSAG